ncbi:MAG: potassium transporter TrkG, partial [Planctomycetaceae bacterium]
DASDSSVLVTMLLMSIGGSPGSTAGGLKTTTFALILMMAWSRLKGDEHTTAWYRTIPHQTASRAVGLFTAGIAVAFTGMLLLTVSESMGPGSEPALLRDCVFEAVSALNTVGLSTGITSELSSAGRIITALLMFLGRVGMLTLAAALTVRRQGSVGFRYANEDVVVG